MFYYDRLLPLELACADLLQFERTDIFNNFKKIWTKYSVYAGSKNPSVLLLNPDLYESGTGEGLWSVYMMGNSDAFIERLMKGDDSHV